MLSTFRTKIKFWSHFILWPVIISFVAFYGWSFLSRPQKIDTAAALVGDVEISPNQLIETRRRIIQYYRDMYKENFEQYSKLLDFDQLALDALVFDALLNDAADELGVKVSTKDIQDVISSSRAFQIDDKFSSEIYLQALRRAGITPAQYEASVAQDLRKSRTRSLLGSSGVISDFELKKVFIDQNVKIDTDYFIFRPMEFRDAVEDSPELAKQYYEDNLEDFRVGDQVKMNYILFDPKTMEDEADIDEFDIEDYYDANFEQYHEPEQIKASHILVTVNNDDDDETVEKAQQKTIEILDKLKAGEDFVTLAKEYSECPSAENGGDLGYFPKGAMDPVFENAAWDLELNQLTEAPVRSQFGFHIIQKTGYKKEGLKSLEDVQDQIEKTLRSSESKTIAMRKAQRLFDQIEPYLTKLVDLTEDSEMTVKTSDFFEPKTPPGLFGYAQNLGDILTNLENDEISIPIETSVGVFLFEIADTKESHIPPFEEVENKARTQSRNAAQADLARKKADSVHTFLLDNHTWEEAVETFDIKTETTGPVSRQTGIPAIRTDESVLDALFEMEPGKISDVYTVYNNSFIFRVTEKIEFDQKAFEGELPKLRRQSLIDRQHHAVDSWLEQRKRELAQQGKYKINLPAF